MLHCLVKLWLFWEEKPPKDSDPESFSLEGPDFPCKIDIFLFPGCIVKIITLTKCSDVFVEKSVGYSQ